MRTVCLLLLLALLAPLHLEADASRTELVKGDTFTIGAYLFNDTPAPTQGQIVILAPPGFELIDASQASATIAPGRAAHVRFVYRVAADAPKGLHTFVVSGGGQTADVVVRVGPVEWRAVWVPMV